MNSESKEQYLLRTQTKEQLVEWITKLEKEFMKKDKEISDMKIERLRGKD